MQQEGVGQVACKVLRRIKDQNLSRKSNGGFWGARGQSFQLSRRCCAKEELANAVEWSRSKLKLRGKLDSSEHDFLMLK